MVNIVVVNVVELPSAIIDAVVSAAQLPDAEIILLVGDPLLANDFQGLTVARRFVAGAANLYGLENCLDVPWECGVTIGRQWAERHRAFPAYFSYLLAHELGHAKTYLSDPLTAAYETFITSHFRAAGCNTTQWHDLPQERRCDQFAKAIVHELHGPELFLQELSELTQAVLGALERLEFLVGLAARKDLEGLRADLAEFALPCKERLIEIWKGARQLHGHHAAQYISDLTQLWSAS